MKKKTKYKLILFLVLLVVGIILYNSVDILSIKEKIINTIENNLQRTGLEIVNGKGYLVNEKDLKNLNDSKITGEKYNFDSNNLYYNILEEKEKKLYKQVYGNIVEVEKDFIPVIFIKTDEINDAIEAVYNDHPELFWINTSYSYKYLSSGKVVQISLSYNSTSKNLNNSKKIFNKNINEIVNNANKYKKDYDKEKYVHDILLKRNVYDENEKLNQSAYSAIVNNKTVCAGYSRAFQLIMNKLKINTYYISGDSKGDHAWNIILLDGDYYNVDLTWDDQNNISYEYFNVPDSIFSKTHIRKGLSIYLPVCRGIKYYQYELKKNEKKDKVEKNKKEETQEKIKIQEKDEVMINENEITQEDIEKQIEKEEEYSYIYKSSDKKN